MEYVNKQTGEVYQAEEVDLNNLCDGDLNFLFTGEFRKLINELDIGDKGNITINIKASKSLDATGDEAIFVEAQFGTKYPKVVISDNNAKKKLLKMVGLFRRLKQVYLMKLLKGSHKYGFI